MAIYKNPFLTRFADRTGLRNSVFLSMYAPQIIRELLNKEELLLPKASWIIGIPGSGKSSILRLFTSDILNEIKKQKITYMHLYEPLVEAKIIENETINTVGIYILIDDLYSEAANVNLGNVDNSRLFYTLFDLRVSKQLISTLCSLENKNGEINKETQVKGVDSDRYPPYLFSETRSCWEFDNIIREKEKLLSSVLTSFPGTPLPDGLELHNRFSSFDLIEAQQELYGKKIILMVDDVHELYGEQFKLLKNAIEKRNSFPRWVATRKHIFPMSRLLGETSGITTGREIFVLDIDNDIYSKPLYRKFIKKLVEKRLKLTSTLHEYDAEQIEALLSEYDMNSENRLEELAITLKTEIDSLAKNFINYNGDITSSISETINHNYVVDLELVLIKVHRTLKKRQRSLFPQLDKKESPQKDRIAAELFIKKRLGLPIYSGFNTIIDASNSNIEQFLRIFSPFADRLIYRVEMDKQRDIEPQEQFKILKAVAKEYKNNVILKLLYGKKIFQLVENLGNFFAFRTYEPNAPYAPGVTQFALTASDMDILENTPNSGDEEWLKELTRILTIAIANNVIVPEGSQHQGTKGSEKKFTFSLNRLLCIQYELPIQKGSFQRIPLALFRELCKRSVKPEEILSRKMNSQGLFWKK